VVIPGRCFRMVQSRQLQATPLPPGADGKAIWTERKGNGWYVEACLEHAPKVTSTASEGILSSAGQTGRLMGGAARVEA